MNDNPFNRVEFDPRKVQWLVLAYTEEGGPQLATRSAFASWDDAHKYANTVASCYCPVIVKTFPKGE